MREAPELPSNGNCIGIYLGTANTQVARFNEAGEAEITNNQEGDTRTPSVVQIDDNGTVIVGTEAKKFVGTGMPDVFAEFKRDMGSEKSWPTGTKTVTPVELSALLLKKVVADYSEQYGAPQSVVITWPANYRHAQREATKQAAALAGLRSVNYIEEPTAAALYYSSHFALDGKYLIYDFGASSLEVTLFEAHHNSIQVVYQDGVQQLGGRDLDFALLKIIGDKFRIQTGDDFDAFDCNFSMSEVEWPKRTLSIKDKTLIRLVSGKHGPIPIDISREEFTAGIWHLVHQAEMACESVLRCGKDDPREHVRKSDIKGIFLLGGTSRVPAMQASVERLFGQKPIVKEPEHAIALGAAIYAAHCAGLGTLNALQAGATTEPTVVHLAGHYLGRTCPLAHGSGTYNDTVISKGTPLPCAAVRKLNTTRAGQRSVSLEVTQSAIEEANSDFVTTIGTLTLELPAGLPLGSPVWAVFEYDRDGSCNVHLFSEHTANSLSLRPSR